MNLDAPMIEIPVETRPKLTFKWRGKTTPVPDVTGGGYASKTLTGASWTVTAGNPSTAAYAAQTWTFTGALTTNTTTYGYYATRLSSGVLAHSETFANFTPAASGDNIILTPQITAD